MIGARVQVRNDIKRPTPILSLLNGRDRVLQLIQVMKLNENLVKL